MPCLRHIGSRPKWEIRVTRLVIESGGCDPFPVRFQANSIPTTGAGRENEEPPHGFQGVLGS